ncbi:MAG: ISKra4 family transposase [Chloroflexales bacterium]|nr:ISKra4 family transposase [Chloroflexales bacterium]
MKLTLQVVMQQDDKPPQVQEIACLERDMLSPETLGLSLQEAKTVLAQLQETLVREQVATAVSAQQTCPHCGATQRRKGQHQIVVRSLFGKLTLDSPRLYTCACQSEAPQRSHSPLAELLPERTTPELQYLQAKWAALLPYGVTVDVLQEVLPLEANHTTVYRQLHQVAERLEGELGDEQPFFVEGCQRDWNTLPRPDGPFTVGIDGGYVHARDGDNRKAGWFEVIVGKSIPTDSEDKSFGFVTDYDTKPKRRLAELLKAQGLQMNQAITFLSDGGDNVRDLQFYLSPIAEHLLDWFHVTMRITVLRQQLKELVARAPNEDLSKLDARFESIKWYVWHGNAFRALQEIQGVQWELEGYEEELPASSKLAKSVREFYGYIEANERFIPNYGERYRYGEAIATGFVESTVNQVISKRMVKKQQMRWTKKGAHLLLQVRTHVEVW